MPELGFCKPCLEKGHRCETRNRDLFSNFICVFCEDGVECPIAKQERQAKQVCSHPGCTQRLIDGNKTNKCGHHSVGEHKAARESVPKKIAPVPPAQPSPTRRKSNSPWEKFGSMGLNRNLEPSAPAMPAVQKGKEEKKMPTGQGLTPCICGCGGMANTRWKYIKGHKPATGAAPIAAAPKKKAATPAADRPLKLRVASSEPLPADTVQISVTSAHLDSWFTQKPLAEKAQLFNNWIKESAAQ